LLHLAGVQTRLSVAALFTGDRCTQPAKERDLRRAGMLVLRPGRRGKGGAATVSLRQACAWLCERPTFNESTFAMVAALETQERARAILQRLNRTK
jgi:hypothetical protein